MTKEEAIEIIISDKIEQIETSLENLKEENKKYNSNMRNLKIDYYEELLKALKS